MKRMGLWIKMESKTTLDISQIDDYNSDLNKQWVAVDDLISLIEEMGAKEQSLFQLYDYLKHKLKLSIGGKC